VIAFVDGVRMPEKALGVVKEADALFLRETDSVPVVPCFIPAAQPNDVQIGPFLGDMLVEKHFVSADTLSSAPSVAAHSVPSTGASRANRSFVTWSQARAFMPLTAISSTYSSDIKIKDISKSAARNIRSASRAGGPGISKVRDNRVPTPQNRRVPKLRTVSHALVR
jgi:hypothetical protein